MPDIQAIVECCEQSLDLDNARLSEGYFYQSLPLCVIDAVYSLRAKYPSTKRVVERYCEHFGIQRIRENRAVIPSRESQKSIEEFLQEISELGRDRFTEEIFNNRQRTSTRNGILKSEAVLRFAKTLKRYEVNYLQDVDRVISEPTFKKEIKCIPGQRRGISLKYFFMLSGSDDFIKPDRMILRFLQNILDTHVTPQEAQELLVEVAQKLRITYPNLTPRLLDHTIWSYQRQLTKGG